MIPTTSNELLREALTHVDALYNHARRLTLNAADADELVQETYTRAVAGAQTFTGGNLKAWLFRILRNSFVDAHRRNRQQPALVELDIMDGAADPALVRDDLGVDGLRRLVAEDIDAALATLSPEARTIVLLDHEGFTETEVAEVIGCALGTVKSRLSRARVLLRERLKDYAPSIPRRGNNRSGDK